MGKLYGNDLDLAERALGGDAAALEEVAEMVRDPKIAAALIRRGASPDEANDIVSELLSGCVVKDQAEGQLRGLMSKYNGKGPLAGYLMRVGLNRLISLKRKVQPVSLSGSGTGEDDGEIDLPAPPLVEGDDLVIDLLRSALVKAFANVDQEKFVMLRLVQSYLIPQKVVGEMWGWSESKVSRHLSSLLEELREEVLRAVHARDPWLELAWEDFLGLCGDSIDLFEEAWEMAQ